MNLNPFLAMILGVTLGASNGVFAKLIGLPATSITFFRVAIPVLVLFCYLSYKKTTFLKKGYKNLFWASVINAPRIFLYYLTFLYTTLGNGYIILYTWPIFAAVFGMLFLKEKVGRVDFLLLGIAFVGIVMMYSHRSLSLANHDIIGMTAMLGSAILTALMMVLFKKEIKGYTKTEMIFHQNLVAAFVFLPFIFINKPFPTLFQAGVGSVYGLVIGIGAWLLFFYALRRIKVVEYALMAYFEVVVAIFYGFLFFNEVLTWNMIIGGLCIIVSGYYLRKKRMSPA